MSAVKKIVVEYIVLGVTMEYLQQVPLAKFESKAEAEEFIKNYREGKSNKVQHWRKVDEKSLVILEKEKAQHIPTNTGPDLSKGEYTGNPLLPYRKKRDEF